MGDVRKVQVDGVRLAYRVWGETDAPAAVLLHCLGEDGEDWRGVVGRLATTHRVFALDQRGHGRSDWPGEYGFERWRDDAIGFVQALGLGPVTLIGHSLGATAALLLAAHRPDLVSRLIVEEPVPPVPADPPQSVPATPPGPATFDWRAKVAVVAERNAPAPHWRTALSAIAAPRSSSPAAPPVTFPRSTSPSWLALSPPPGWSPSRAPATSSTRSARRSTWRR
ncbi:alpha/beta fold hydrolase [Streptomyces albulus]|nr:alpha/beta fold hydrolase [Streptomyces noursei]